MTRQPSEAVEWQNSHHIQKSSDPTTTRCPVGRSSDHRQRDGFTRSFVSKLLLYFVDKCLQSRPGYVLGAKFPDQYPVSLDL